MVALGSRYRQYRHRQQSEPWLLAIRRLHSNGWSDREIAEALWDLSPERIGQLEESRQWNWRAVEKAREPEAGDTSWSKRKVEYVRSKVLGLEGVTRKFECLSSQGKPSLVGSRTTWANCLAYDAGWGHLVGRRQELERLWTQYTCLDVDRIAKAVGWSVELVLGWARDPWDSLQPNEAIVLTLLAGHPDGLTFHQLRHHAQGVAQRMGLSHWPSLERNGRERKRLLRRMVNRELVTIRGLSPNRGRWGRVHGLPPWMKPHERTPFLTSIERLAGQMA